MPRYDDRYGNTTRLYVGHLSSRTRARDLEHIFSRYGRVRDVDMKQDFAFVDFSDPRDADDARYSLNGRDVDGRRIIVELAKGVPRGPGGVREYIGRGPAPGSGRCFNCGIDGHWARDCKAGDWKNKCYRCGERGHIERNCKNSPKKLRSGRSYSRSPVRSRSPRRSPVRSRSPRRSPVRSRSPRRSPVRSRSPRRSPVRSRSPRRSPVISRSPRRGRGRSRSYSRSHSYSRSRSPPVRERMVDREERRPRSPRYSVSPDAKKGTTAPKSRRRSPTPDGNGKRVENWSPDNNDGLVKGRDEKSPSPGSPERLRASPDMNASPFEGNGYSRSPSPREGKSPADDDVVEDRRTPRGSESP